MRLFAALLIAFLLANRGPQSEGLASLVARMRTASGAPSNATLRSTWLGKNTDEQFSMQSQGTKFLVYRCIGARCVGKYFDGKHSFSVDPNDATLPLGTSSDAGDLTARIIATQGYLDPHFVQSGGKMQLEPPYDRDGKRRAILLVTLPNGYSSAVWVDPVTALVSSYDVDGHHVALRDYRPVGPLHLPFRIIDAVSGTRIYQTRTVLSTPLRIPHGVRSTPLASVPPAHRIAGSALPIFPCVIAHVAARCLIDTGNAGFAMSLAFSEKIDAKVLGTGVASGLSTYATEIVNAGPLVLANERFDATTYLVLPDISNLGFDVILGNSLFASLPATIDSTTLIFGTRPMHGSHELAIHFPAFVPEFSAQVDGITTDFTLDTGDVAGLDFADEFVRAHPSVFAQTGTRMVKGVGGSAVTQLGKPLSLTLAQCTTTRFPVQKTPDMPIRNAGRIGAKIFEYFRVRLDYQHGSMQLAPLPGKANATCTQFSP